MIKKLHYILLTLLLICSYSFSQGFGTIKGTVIDGERKDPIWGATITLTQNGVVKGIAKTGLDGDFQIDALQPGQYDVSFENKAEVYKPGLRTGVTVSADKYCVLNDLYLTKGRYSSYGGIIDFRKEVKKIHIVSYRGASSLIEDKLYQKTDGSIYSGFEDQQTLIGRKKNKLIDLVYSDNTSDVQGMCYNPRNAIIFYDSEKKEIGYLEICFECTTMKTTSQIPEVFQLSEKGYNELESIFEKHGLIKN